MLKNQFRQTMIIVGLLTLCLLSFTSCGDSSVNYHRKVINPDRGDINLNGTPFQIADAVMFSNYFIYGTGVFVVDKQRQIDASDANNDGKKLGLADLQFMIRVIVGDARPMGQMPPTSATYSHNDNVIRINSEMGAAYVVIYGNVVPTLLADNMEMKFNYDGSNTRILVYSNDPNSDFSGDFINVNGDIASIEFATYEGGTVIVRHVLSTSALKQNYPNPFSTITKIGFDLEQPGYCKLIITDINRRFVANYSGDYTIGSHEIIWDATNLGSGLYFCTMTFGNYTKTIKLSLIR